jgi:hypothetical protein
VSKVDEFDGALRSALDLLRSGPESERRRVVTVIGLLLERDSDFPSAERQAAASNEGFLRTTLPAPLLARRLRPSEEALVVDELHGAFLGIDSGARDEALGTGLLWALGRANPWVGLPPVLDLVVNHAEEMSLHEVHQAVHALERCLELPPDHPRHEDVRAEVRAMDPRPVLARLLESDLEMDHETECLPQDVRDVLDLVGEP